MQRFLEFVKIARENIQFGPKLLTLLGIVIFAAGSAKFAANLTLNLISADDKDAGIHTQFGGIIRKKNNSVINDVASIVRTNGKLFSQPEMAQAGNSVNPDSGVEIAFQLEGTLEGHKSFARAIVTLFENPVVVNEYAIGEKIGNAKLIAIGREFIRYQVNGKTSKLNIGEKVEKSGNAAPVTTNTTGQTEAAASNDSFKDGEVVRKMLSREEVMSIMKGNQATLYKGANFGPNLVNDKIDGYKIHRVSNDHIFYKLGARAGDVIKKVNGFGMNDTERMFELWKNIPTASRIKVEIVRNNKNIIYDFHVQN